MSDSQKATLSTSDEECRKSDSHHRIVTPQTLDSSPAKLGDLRIGDSPNGLQEDHPSCNEGRSFIVDPNILAQWNKGQERIVKKEAKEGTSQKSQSKADQTPRGHANDTEGPPSDEDPAPGDPASVGVGSIKKKRTKRKSKSKRGLAAPSGFEEFYVDAPLTPAEFEEEQGLYEPDIEFPRRIETAIQRYCARRRMDSAKKDVFDKYLSFGGISSGPKQFSGGLNTEDMADMNAADIALMKAIHFVDLEKWGDDDAYDVDFESCAKAFFSSRAPWVYDLSGTDREQHVKSKTNVIRNFLNYLLHHNVCPEYDAQILHARAVCDQTEKELPMVMRTQSNFPGDFQTACSEIFGGSFQGTCGQNIGWTSSCQGSAGISPEVAMKTFKAGMATHASDDLARTYMEQSKTLDITAVKVYNTGLEVSELVRASKEVKDFYKGHPAAKGLKPLGRLIAKTWELPYKLPRDLTDEERAAEGASAKAVETHSFLVEDYVLETCFVGMKFEATVREMSFGLKYFDTVAGVFCSFYTLLPNELMIGWRVPEAEPLPYRVKNDPTKALEDDSDGIEEDEETTVDVQQVNGKEAENMLIKTKESGQDVPSIVVSEVESLGDSHP
ncbi:MAG: hypothetical protein Q9219_005358 [cf. Caloplaca sp. 3 TL-2023]